MMLTTNRIVIRSDNEEDFFKVKAVYKPLFPNIQYIHVDVITAEMIKYCGKCDISRSNCYSQWNIYIYQLCESVHVNYETIKNIDVSEPDGNLGFEGKYFPKDLNALIYLSREHNYRPYLLEEIWRLNEKIRKNKDWLDIKGATNKKYFFVMIIYFYLYFWKFLYYVYDDEKC